MVQLVRNEYRMALHITERLLACFTHDHQWFKEKARDLRDKQSLCKIRIKKLREKVKEKLPLMRIYLALSLKNKLTVANIYSGEDPDLYQVPTRFTLDHILSMPQEFNNTASVFIAHSFSTVSMKPLRAEELERALQILNGDLAWIRHKHGGPQPEHPAHCFQPNKRFPRKISEARLKTLSPDRAMVFLGDGIGPGERGCYYDLYMAFLFGGQMVDKPWTQGIKGFPLLAYISEDQGTDEAIIQALRKRLELTPKGQTGT